MSTTVEAEIVDEPTSIGEEAEIEKPRLGRIAVKLVATSSIRFVVSSAITTLVPVESKRDKKKVFVASMVLSGMINEKVKPYVDGEIDEALEFVREVRDKIRELQASDDQSN